ncbi:hypothetical protein CesoFtcFv8_026198 [Champsocephalus esox]|uniref:Uncharacterized protein n=1 Tax=Champsocephalus esox TaxID=159716 RepID=A0AAN8GF92_9TELE|nr:hypothetical protein CesoFtcFv8_026198 [Champsocephalus esox]
MQGACALGSVYCRIFTEEGKKGAGNKPGLLPDWCNVNNRQEGHEIGFSTGVMRQRNKGCLRGEVAYMPGNLFKAHHQMDITPPPATSRS